uniref:Putative secreted protein n=1 Tax=Anopheles darlingi TaxID=43151 RepID=A0A2M4D0K5_ANODA
MLRARWPPRQRTAVDCDATCCCCCLGHCRGQPSPFGRDRCWGRHRRHRWPHWRRSNYCPDGCTDGSRITVSY